MRRTSGAVVVTKMVSACATALASAWREARELERAERAAREEREAPRIVDESTFDDGLEEDDDAEEDDERASLDESDDTDEDVEDCPTQPRLHDLPSTMAMDAISAPITLEIARVLTLPTADEPIALDAPALHAVTLQSESPPPR